MKRWGFFLALTIVWFLPGDFVLAAPIVPGSFSTIWQSDNSGTSLTNQVSFYLGTGVGSESCTGTLYWEEVGNDTNNGSSTLDASCNQEIITFPTPGTYRVDVLGTHPSFRFSFGVSDDRQKLISLEQWGNNVWVSAESMFEGATNLVGNASDVPDLSTVTSMREMFSGAANFNQNINNWDVSNVTDMTSLFAGALIFNQPLDDWDVSNVTTLEYLFYFAGAFNQSLNNWNVQNVDNAAYVFYFAGAFNQPLNNWNISNVTTMSNMFSGAPLSETNYTSLLTSWSVLAVQSGVNLGTDAQYCGTAQAARDILTTSSWVITDGGSTDVCIAEEVEDAESSSRGSATRVGDRLKNKLSDTNTTSTAAVTSNASFFESVRTLVDQITKNEDRLDELTPEESTKLIVMLREIIIYMLDLIPGV